SWSGGTIGGSGQLNIPNTTTVTFNGYVYYDTRAVNNAGTLVYTSSYYSYFYSGATLTNSGTVKLQGDGGFYIGGGSDSISGAGIVQFTAGTNTVSATYNVTGSTRANGGTTTIGTAITSTGDLLVSGGTLTLNRGAALSVATLTMQGGTLNGTMPISLTGA